MAAFIKPTDEVVIRIARSEMGQGSLVSPAWLSSSRKNWTATGAKSPAKIPPPGQNLARNRVWGDMWTGGSRGIRGSH